MLYMITRLCMMEEFISSLLFSLWMIRYVFRSLCVVIFRMLNLSTMVSLAMTINDEEVRNVLFCIGPLKALGPDGFYALFYQSQWDTVVLDVCTWIHDVFFGKLPIPSINNTRLVLILKIKSPISLSHFRPIIVCNDSNDSKTLKNDPIDSNDSIS